MKRRAFIKETTIFTGLGLSSVSCYQAQIKKAEEPFEVCVTMDQEKVSFIVILSKKK